MSPGDREKEVKITAGGERIYHERELTPEEQQDGCHVRGPMPGPDVTNKEIEADEHRRRLRPGEGSVCISVCPGDALGEIYVGVQYEGPKGSYEECMKGHNEFLAESAQWLRDALETFSPDGAEWEVSVASSPCDKASIPPITREALQVVAGEKIEIPVDGTGPVVHKQRLDQEVE